MAVAAEKQVVERGQKFLMVFEYTFRLFRNIIIFRLLQMYISAHARIFLSLSLYCSNQIVQILL